MFTDEGLLNVRVVVKIEFAHDVGYDIGRDGFLAPVFVEGFETCGDDAARDGFAAMAAELSFLAQHRGAGIDAWIEW